jgi:hypothetical protein
MCTLKLLGFAYFNLKKKGEAIWESMVYGSRLKAKKKKKTKKLTQIRKWRENEPQKEKTNQPMRCDLSNLVAIITLHPLCNNITSDFWV